MKKKHLLWVAMALFAMPLAAQTDMGVFAPFVSRLSAHSDGNSINLSWIDSKDIHGPVYLYRSNTPFLGPDPELGEVLAEIPYGVQSYVDRIIGGETFYYFALASDENGRKFNYPITSINTISARPGMGTPSESQQFDHPMHPMSAEMHEQDYLYPIPPMMYRLGPPTMNPRVFLSDLEPFQRTADDHALTALVRGSFAARDWEAAKYDFIYFLTVPRSPETRSRARFYLGQCLYFLQEPREGLFEFLTVQDRFPYEIAEWIQAVYNMMNYDVTYY